MEAKTQPAEATLAPPTAARKLCRVCCAAFRYSPLNVWPDYCPVCIHSSSRWHVAASVDGRSPVPSPGGHLPGGELLTEPLLISRIAGAPSAEGDV